MLQCIFQCYCCNYYREGGVRIDILCFFLAVLEASVGQEKVEAEEEQEDAKN